MKIKETALLVIAAFYLVNGIAVAAEKEGFVEKVVKAPLKVLEPIVGNNAKDKAPEKEKKEPTMAELLDHLKMTLEHDDEVLGFIPGLKKEQGADGLVNYTYKGVRIEDLDEKNLRSLYTKTQSELTRIRTERINRQLESIRQGQQATRAAEQSSRVPRMVTAPPQPPQIPPNPPSVVQAPKPPPIPPQPPRQK